TPTDADTTDEALTDDASALDAVPTDEPPADEPVPAGDADTAASDGQAAAEDGEAGEAIDAEELLEEAAAPPVESPYDRPGRWYVVHTQSGYEKKVKQNLEARIQSMNME